MWYMEVSCLLLSTDLLCPCMVYTYILYHHANTMFDQSFVSYNKSSLLTLSLSVSVVVFPALLMAGADRWQTVKGLWSHKQLQQHTFTHCYTHFYALSLTGTPTEWKRMKIILKCIKRESWIFRIGHVFQQFCLVRICSVWKSIYIFVSVYKIAF